MQSDPQDEQQPMRDDHGGVPPHPDTGPEPHPPTDSPAYGSPPGEGIPPRQEAPPPAPPQMPGAPSQVQPPGFSPPPPPPRMPAPSTPPPALDMPASGEAPSDTGQAPQPGTGPSDQTPPPEPPPAPGGQPNMEALPGTNEAVPDSGQPPPVPVAEASATAEGDWLDRICPYLLSEDGTYRSTQPDAGHRCTAQDPPGTLPLAFQERFCLSDRHVRCEMYKYAQATRSAALEEEGIPAAQVSGARFKPSVRSVPLALGPAEDGTGRGSSRWPIVFIAAAVAALVILALVLATLFGGGGDDPGPGPVDGASPSPQATMVATPPPQPTLEPTPEPDGTPEPESSPLGSAAPAVATTPVNYEVQEGEALLAIAEKFGVTRRRILRANEGMDEPPYVEAGDVIIVPAASSLTIEELEAIPGFLGLAE